MSIFVAPVMEGLFHIGHLSLEKTALANAKRLCMSGEEEEDPEVERRAQGIYYYLEA